MGEHECHGGRGAVRAVDAPGFLSSMSNILILYVCAGGVEKKWVMSNQEKEQLYHCQLSTDDYRNNDPA